jgi:histidine phosphotransfer protein HptB
MDKEAYRLSGIDYEEGVSRFVGHAELYEKFLKKFLADPEFAALEKALADGDAEAAFQTSHSLKGVTGNLSMNALYRALVPLVDALRGGGDLALARTLFPAVQAEYRRVMDFVEKL